MLPLHGWQPRPPCLASSHRVSQMLSSFADTWPWHTESKAFGKSQPALQHCSCNWHLKRACRESERDRFTMSIQPAWFMRTGLCSRLSLLQQGNETMADRLLVLVPHAYMHAPRSILEQARKLGPDVTAMGAIKYTMELIAHSLCIANSAPAKVAREGWPGNWPCSMGRVWETSLNCTKARSLLMPIGSSRRAQIADY